MAVDLVILQLSVMASHAVHILKTSLGACQLVTDIISSAVMQSGMCIHDSVIFMVMFISGISSSLFVLWLYSESQFNMKSCSLDLYSILMLYWYMHSNILCILCDKIATTFEDSHHQFVAYYQAVVVEFF